MAKAEKCDQRSPVAAYTAHPPDHVGNTVPGPLFGEHTARLGERAEHRAGHSIADVFGRVSGVRRDWASLVALLGFGHGILAPEVTHASLQRDMKLLRSFIYLGVGRELSPIERVRPLLERFYHGLPQVIVPRRIVPWWRKVPPW